ncbi:MAG: hypothetical protein WCI09_00800 [Planctomycetota bacterium]
MTDRVNQRLTSRGPGIVERQTGRAVTDTVERRAAVETVCVEFFKNILPDLLMLGIVSLPK